MSHPKRILYPPSPDVSLSESSGPVSVGAKKCPECRMERSFSHYGLSRSKPDGFNSSCRECINQTKRISHHAKYGHVKPRPQEDSCIRNNLHHNRQLIARFLHGTDYELHGVALHIPSRVDFTFVLARPENTSLVTLHIRYDGLDYKLVGCDRLKEEPISELCSVLREYRLEPTLASMQMAKIYIYDQP